MPETGFIAVFLIGLLGGTHCVGMCGGIVSALATQVAPSSLPGASLPKPRPPWRLHLAYNFGRIFSYTLAGAFMGAVSSLGLLLQNVLPVQLALYVAANGFMVALGLYLIGFTQGLTPVENLGRRVWKRIQPLTGRFLPVRSTAQALGLGMLWGWLPCGLVYSMLAAALMTGSALRGAATLLVFGLGTLPNLLLAGVLLARFRRWVQASWVRMVSGLIVLGFGVFGLFNATTLGARLWQGVVCNV